MAKTLAQILIAEQKKRGMTDRMVAERISESQQTFNAWKRGTLPRLPRPKLASFLSVTDDDLRVIVESDRAAAAANEKSLAVYAAARVYGRMADRKEGKLKFDTSRKTIPEGRYAVIVDTKIMEPVLHVGSKIWLDPGVWPKIGNEVIAHAYGFGWIGRLERLDGGHVLLSRYGAEPIEIKNIDAVHVIVLSERV